MLRVGCGLQRLPTRNLPVGPSFTGRTLTTHRGGESGNLRRSLIPIDRAPDGKQLAISPQPQAEDEKGSVHVTFFFNFFDELRRRTPADK